MRITLILAASKTDPLRGTDPFMPLSLPILAGVAPDHDYRFIDLFHEDDIDFDFPADLVGISVRFTAEKRAYEISGEFRKRGVKVILGGPQPSAVPMRAIQYADSVVIGEAETLWPVIIEDVIKNDLKDFYVCSPVPFDGGGKRVFQIFEYPDLSKNFPVNRSPFKRKYTFETIQATRGCPIDCDFCSVTRLFGSSIRKRAIRDVVKEIDTFGQYFYLIDDTVFGRPDTYDYYLELYQEISKLRKKRFWTGQANLDAVSDPLGQKVIEEAAKSGLIYAAVGIESINPATLKSSGAIRKAGVKNAEEAISKICENIRFIQDKGIIVSGWFVLGYENDTIDTYYETLEFCLKMKILPAIFPVKVLPGTRLHERLSKEGKLDDTRLINFRNPKIKDEDVFIALKKIREKGYSLKENFKRLRFYYNKFKSDKIHKTIFLMILQSRIAGGLDVSNDEFFIERE